MRTWRHVWRPHFMGMKSYYCPHYGRFAICFPCALWSMWKAGKLEDKTDETR